MTLRSSWPGLGDFVFRKRRKKGRRGRRGSAVAKKEARRRWALDAWARNPMLKRMVMRQATETLSPTWLDAPLAPASKHRRVYRDQVIVRDPFKGKTCPGCGAVFSPSYPPIKFDRKDRDFGWLSGRCLRCVKHAANVK